MSPDDTALLVVDVQEKLVPLIAEHARMVWNIRRLLDAADLLGVHVAATEQYPKGLGRTVEPLRQRLAGPGEKTLFSCRECGAIFRELEERALPNVLVAGIEAHVCVQQTVLDLLGEGFRVLVAVDAAGSRAELDRETAFRRMELSGATLTTTEAVLFEWCESAANPHFKAISQLVRELPPG